MEVLDRGQKTVEEAVPERTEAWPLALAQGLGHLDRLAHARSARHVLRPRAKAALLAPAVDQRRDLDALAHPQRADALRAVELVRREREEIDTEG